MLPIWRRLSWLRVTRIQNGRGVALPGWFSTGDVESLGPKWQTIDRTIKPVIANSAAPIDFGASQATISKHRTIWDSTPCWFRMRKTDSMHQPLQSLIDSNNRAVALCPFICFSGPGKLFFWTQLAASGVSTHPVQAWSMRAARFPGVGTNKPLTLVWPSRNR